VANERAPEGRDGSRFCSLGSGSLAIFTIYGPDYMTKAKCPGDEDFALWKIKPSGGYLYGTRISDWAALLTVSCPLDMRKLKPKGWNPCAISRRPKILLFC